MCPSGPLPSAPEGFRRPKRSREEDQPSNADFAKPAQDHQGRSEPLEKTEDRTALGRSHCEHRAIWLALLVEEAEKRGLDTAFAHEAVRRCGAYHGLTKYAGKEDLEDFAKVLMNEDAKAVFEMERLPGEGLRIDFHYCPLVAAWKKLGVPAEKLPELCRIAMEGDRAIAEECGLTFTLGETIAEGAPVCQLLFE